MSQGHGVQGGFDESTFSSIAKMTLNGAGNTPFHPLCHPMNENKFPKRAQKGNFEGHLNHVYNSQDGFWPF